MKNRLSTLRNTTDLMIEPAPRLKELRTAVDRYLLELDLPAAPATLYDPIRYVLHAPGKRIRPLLTLLAGRLAGAPATNLMPLAAAIEIFHNFTLVHDDIMDHAAERRGNPTVHTKWDENVAILSGDMMVGLAYRLIMNTETDHLRAVMQVFQESVDAVCEGQALDKEFENRETVSLPDYIGMIEKKTGWLISSALRVGWVAIRGNDETATELHKLAMAMGRGFQIQDDFLDLMADQASFGKRIGGDIVEGKRTYLLLLAAERATGADADLIHRIMTRQVGFDSIDLVRQTFKRLRVLEDTEKAINECFAETADRLNHLGHLPDAALLKFQVEQVLNRTF